MPPLWQDAVQQLYEPGVPSCGRGTDSGRCLAAAAAALGSSVGSAMGVLCGSLHWASVSSSVKGKLSVLAGRTTADRSTRPGALLCTPGNLPTKPGALCPGSSVPFPDCSSPPRHPGLHPHPGRSLGTDTRVSHGACQRGQGGARAGKKPCAAHTFAWVPGRGGSCCHLREPPVPAPHRPMEDVNGYCANLTHDGLERGDHVGQGSPQPSWFCRRFWVVGG